MKKIIILPTIGDSREDGSVYYSGFVIVESDTLAFDEPIFVKGDQDSVEMTQDEVLDHLRGLGYTVEEPDTAFIHVEED